MFRKIIKKRDIAIFFGTLFLFLYILIFLLLKSSAFQSLVASRVAKWMSEELKAPVSIGSVDFTPFFSVKVTDVFLGDQKGDTIAYIPELSVFIRNIGISDKKLDVGTISLNQPVIRLIKDENGFRYKYLIDYFKADTTVQKDSSKWKISFLGLKIKDASFAYRKLPVEPKAWGVNFRDIAITDLNITADEIEQQGDTLLFHLHQLSLKEKSGMEIVDFAAKLRIDPEKISTEKLTIITSGSMISMEDFSMKYTSLDDFDLFEENVRMSAKIKPSKINMKDISYFSSYLKGIDETLILSGEVKGTVSSFRGKKVTIKLLDKTLLMCDFSINGLPDAENAFWHIDFKQLRTTMTEVGKIPVPPFISKNRLELPHQLDKFGSVYYQGQFSGFFTDFVAFGTFKTDLGVLSTDVSLKQDSTQKKLVLKGKLSSPSIQVGALAGVSENIGDAGFSVNADGVIFNNGNFDMDLKGEVEHIQVRKYTYRNLLVNGNVTEKRFDGELHVDDPNMKLDFSGKVDFSSKIPVYNFNCTLKNMYYSRLNFYGKDTMARMSLNMEASFEGDQADNINGQLNITDFDFKSSKNTFGSRTINVVATQAAFEKNISIKSDIADVGISGHFSFLNVVDAVLMLAGEYFPSLQTYKIDEKTLKEIEANAYFCDFDIYTGDTKGFLNEIAPGFEVAENSSITGNVDFSNRSLEFESAAGKFTYENYTAESMELSGSAAKKTFNLALFSKTLKQDKGFTAEQINMTLNGHTDTAFVELGWENSDSISFAGNVAGMVRFFRSPENKPAVSFESSPSLLVVADTAWYLNEGILTYMDSSVFVNNLIFNHNDQYIYANGAVGAGDEKLSLIISGFNLNNINTFISSQGYDLQGIMTGTAEISGISSSLRLISDFEIDKLIVNGEDLGRTLSKATYNAEKQRIDVDGTMNRGVIKTIDYKGYVTTQGDLDFDLELTRVRMKIFEPFMTGLVSELKGDISGNIKVKGRTESPEVTGKLSIQKANFVVDYLQTRYNFTGDVNITKNSFEVNDLRLFDANGNYADVTGKVTHNNFKDIRLLFQMTAKNFLMLNTKPADNELFYGKALASGIVDVSGDLDNIYLNINVKTEKNTRFFIPLTSTSEVSENDFITYVSAHPESVIAPAIASKVTGLKMDFNLNVTPDAEVQIIFDSKAGDIIRGQGNGNLRMEINTLGDFNLFGEYVIEQGDYLFTLQNIINKKFEVEKGGTIRWNGDPYEAILDLKAIYRLKTSLYDLTLDSTNKSRVAVECILSMKNSLMQPDMSFSINLPTTDTKAQGILSNLPSDEINKQIISLLVMNRFVTPESMKGGIQAADSRSSGNALGVNSSELLSNQLSNWLSQISKDVDVGVNYRPGDEMSSDELEVALSTQILNDRVSINGNVGVGGQQHNTSGQFLGDFEVEVKVNRSGKLRVKGFTKSNETLIYDTSPYRQGLGLFYREDFDTFGGLMKRYWDGIFRRKKEVSIKK